jgi:hypothetical protein
MKGFYKKLIWGIIKIVGFFLIIGISAAVAKLIFPQKTQESDFMRQHRQMEERFKEYEKSFKGINIDSLSKHTKP